MALPVQRPKRRWGIIVGWALCAFAGGVAAGPLLGEYADIAVNGTAGFLGKHVPWMLGKYRPAPVYVPPPPVQRVRRPAPPPVPVAAQPVAAPPPTPTAAPAPQPVKVVSRERPVVTELAASPEPPVRRGHPKAAAKAPAVAVAAPTKKATKSRDPFEDGGGAAGAPKAEPKAAPAAKTEPAPKPAARSSDALDNLMADVMTETKGKGKKSPSKAIDAMLKDVQKSEPAPAPKKAAAAELPPLSAADISRVMGKVKTRANGCGQQFGDKGTAELKVTVGKDGRVSNVAVGGKVAGTKTGTCVEKAVRAAVFPPNSGLKFDYRIDVR
jgi:hypothetical protein